jgi:DNA/RNA endonuclease YhcR with UshA esterase domain
METNIPKEEKDNLEQVRETPTVKNTELTNYPDECFCPSCGKFVGAYERCPMCQASMKTRMELKLVKRIAVFGAIIGVLLLWFASARKEIPIVKIEDIKINNNLAIITVRGTVININVNDTAKNFSITLDDETDTIKIINAGKLDEFRNIFREKFPKPGDLIEVTGNVSISEKWGASMFLSSTRRMKVLKRLEIEELKLAEISEKNLNQTLMIKNVEIIKTNTQLDKTLLLKTNQENSRSMYLTAILQKFRILVLNRLLQVKAQK